VHVVVPEGVDDPRRPSGGNVYDRRLCTALRGTGWEVEEHAVPGRWPSPGATDRAALVDALAGIPDGAAVLVDGLVASAAPEELGHESRRLRLVALVHMPLEGAAERAALMACAAVVTTSTWTRDLLLAGYPVAGSRVVVAEPGTEPAGPAPGTTGGRHLLVVAAVTRAKGHDVLLAALDSLADLAWRCRCVGAVDVEPELVKRLRRQVEHGPAAGRVTFDGPLTGTALDAAYREADLLVLPSRTESYGMVVTEALARGVPVVATCVGGVPEALGGEVGEEGEVGGRPGVLVPPGDAAALAGALRRWLADLAWRRRLRASAAARRHTLPGWDRTAARVADVLSRVLAEVAS
jgi:glycosyltransferase involved in cell wall biosynthesis